MDNDTQRIIGALVEFKEHTNKEFQEIKKELRKLTHYKLKVAGGVTAITLVIQTVFAVLQTLKH